MADKETLAALEQVMMTARIASVTGTEAQWTAADPVLLKGEIGLVENTSPVKFKVGDGVKKWSALGWGQPTTLAQLAPDASHRLVTDAEKAAWNAKADKTYTDNAIADEATKRTQGDAAALQSAKTYTDTSLTEERVVRESGDRTTLESAKSYADKKIADVVNGSPEALDTLKELSDALGGDANFSATVAGQIGKKVDKVTGKGLSTEDYTTGEKAKLAGITAGANNYIHPSTHPASMITPDATHRFVTDVEKSTWDSKAEKTAATASAAGLMSAADKQKLDDLTGGSLIIKCSIPGME